MADTLETCDQLLRRHGLLTGESLMQEENGLVILGGQQESAKHNRKILREQIWKVQRTEQMFNKCWENSEFYEAGRWAVEAAKAHAEVGDGCEIAAEWCLISFLCWMAFQQNGSKWNVKPY